MTSGGGSAQLLETYTVSPLEGIKQAAEAIGADVEYSVGAFSHKYLPLLDAYIHQNEVHKPGALVEFWNEAPSNDFLSPKPDFRQGLKDCAWSTPTRSTYCFLADGVVRYLFPRML